MVRLLSFVLPWIVIIIPFTTAIPQPNYNTLVNLRIEGRDRTIFEGPIQTRGHNVTTPHGGSHHCDGTNHGHNSEPGPTGTSALDDAARNNGFSWDGTYAPAFDDFFVTSIGGDEQTSNEFWGLLVNWEITLRGGCQQRVSAGDDILWAFDAFNLLDFLRLEGPTTARVNRPVTLTVTDGATGALIGGADVEGSTSDARGHVTVVFRTAGEHAVKATRARALRSNALVIIVTP